MIRWRNTKDYDGLLFNIEGFDLPELEGEDDSPTWMATVRWDGCIHLYRLYYDIPDEPDYLHICDLDELIKGLQDLREKAVAHFAHNLASSWKREEKA